MSQRRTHASARLYEDGVESSDVRLRAQPTSPASKGPSRSSPTRSSPSRGSRARPSAPPPGLYSHPHRTQPPNSAATATSSWVGARGREDYLGEPVDTASKHVVEGTGPLRDESSFIDNFFFASGETLVAPAAPTPDVQVEDVTSIGNRHHDEETSGATVTDHDVLSVRASGVGHTSTSTSASSDAAGTPTRTQSRFSSWFHEPAQEDAENEDGLTITSWGNRRAQSPSVTPESGSWRRRPSDPPRREERPADDTKSWRRGPPVGIPTEPTVSDASSLAHPATRPAMGKEKDQRKPSRPRDRSRNEPEDKTKKGGSSRRSVAPPPGFASERIVSPPPGFGQDLAKESQPANLPTAVPSPLHGDGSQGAAGTMTPASNSGEEAGGSVPTDHPEQPEVGPLLDSAAPHMPAPPLQGSAPSASNPRTRSLKNYLPARSNAKSLSSLAATLPLSFSASTSAASSPFPPLGQQPFSAPLAMLSPPHFLSAPLRPGLAPPHSPSLLGSMQHMDGHFPLAQLPGAYTSANGLHSLTYEDQGHHLGQDQL